MSLTPSELTFSGHDEQVFFGGLWFLQSPSQLTFQCRHSGVGEARCSLCLVHMEEMLSLPALPLACAGGQEGCCFRQPENSRLISVVDGFCESGA